MLKFLFVLDFIYLSIVIYGSFPFEKLFDFISAHFWFNIAIYLSWKTSYVEKAFSN